MQIVHKQDTGDHSIALSAPSVDCSDNWSFGLVSGRGYKSKHEAKCRTLALIEEMQKALTKYKTQLENF